MRRIDVLHLNYPFAGSRMLQALLRNEGYQAGRLHVRNSVKRMGVEALYRRPKISKPALRHKIYPYLLCDFPVIHPNGVCFFYLVAAVDWFTCRVLLWRLSITLELEFCIEALVEALSRYHKPDIFNTNQDRNTHP